MENLGSLIALIISLILTFITFIIVYVTQKKNSQLKNSFLAFMGLIFFWTLCSTLQICLQKFSIDPFIFTQISGPAVFFTPVAFLALSSIFSKTKIRIERKDLLWLVIPTISTILILTNEHHQLFYANHSSNSTEMVYGKYFMVHSLYTYALYFIGLVRLLKYSIKNSGIFSNQSLLILMGTSVPVVLNLLGTSNIIPQTTYITPISFSFLVLFYALAIFKFQFISTTPIALQKIVDRMSDSYLILDEYYNITDFNATFLNTFNINAEALRRKNIFNLSNNIEMQKEFKNILKKLENSKKTFQIEQEIPEISKVFTVEINNIYTKNNFLGILILFKDITQHKKDIQTIQNNQDILVEQERLASLGQMIGGIAHNLKTPIFSVTGGLEGLGDLVKEFDMSIDNPSVTNEDMHDIAKDMNKWIDKLQGHISYMSDVITTVKGQAVTLSEDETIDFSVTELFKRVDILMKHEIKNALATLEILNDVGDKELLSGNINNLVQIINNIISNAIEAYGKTSKEKLIQLTAVRDNSNVIIAIKDYGPGIPEVAQDKIFKEMITTKGKDGTGLGLFMSYSNIKAHFNGNLTYETELGKGTTFFISIPIAR